MVRDYDGNPYYGFGPIPIKVDQHLAMDASGALKLTFDTDPWSSTISFAPGIPVTRGGTLELAFAPDVNLASQIGRTINLFDWTGVMPTSAFTVSSPYTWDLTNLYTTGEVTLAAVPSLPGDFNNDGAVDAAHYVVWRKTGGTLRNEYVTVGSKNSPDYEAWLNFYGGTPAGTSNANDGTPVPEQTSVFLLLEWCHWLRHCFSRNKTRRTRRFKSAAPCTSIPGCHSPSVHQNIPVIFLASHLYDSLY